MSNPRPMAGKTCLVTGATRGIGRVTAIALAAQGAHVTLVGRDADRTEAAAQAVRAAAGVEGGSVRTLLADLSSLAEIRRLAAEVRASHARLDVLVNNAGNVFSRRTLTVDGHEATFALNHLGYFLLTHELRDLLTASAPARIVNVASRAHRAGRLRFDDLMHERRYTAWRAYSASKLANILFTRELARRLAGTGVTANCLHPGVVATHLGQDRFGLVAIAMTLARPFMISEEEGAATTIHLATAPELAGRSGEYWADMRLERPEPHAEDDAAALQLWEVSERLCGLAPAPAPAFDVP